MKISAYLWFSYVILVFLEVNCLIHKIAKYDPDFYWINQPFCGLRHKADYNGFCLGYEYKQILFEDETYHNETNSRRNRRTSLNNIDNSDRMLYGVDLVEGQSPWTVFVRRNKPSGQTRECIGTLISFNWIITAAHCIRNTRTIDQIRVWAGSVNRDTAQKRSVYKFLIHKSLDIALMKVSEPFEQTENNKIYTLNTICLPVKNVINTDEMKATFIGKQIDNNQRLQRGEVIIKKSSECYARLLCSIKYEDGVQRLCQGDSGGPLYQFTKDFQLTKAVLIGVEIYLLNTTNDNNPIIYCRSVKQNVWISVSQVMDWILNTTQYN